MIDAIKESISKDFTNLSFDVTSWKEVLKDSLEVSVFHLQSSINYYAAYHEGTNISFLLHENNTPLVVFPLFAYTENNQWILSSNGEGIIAPLFIQGTPKKLKKRLEKQIAEIIYIIAHELKIENVRFFEPNLILSSWYLLWLEKNNKDFLKYQLD